MNPELIDPHWDKRGCPNWFEYARRFRTIHVTVKKVGIGNMFTAYLPDGYVHSTPDIQRLITLMRAIDCRKLEIEGAL